jgi:hypothetical protein
MNSMRTAALSVGASGEDVAKLQALLIQHGFVIPQPEVNRKFFGQGTRQGVRRFQQANALPITGSVDDGTYAAMAAPVPYAPPTVSPSVVSGAAGGKGEKTTIALENESPVSTGSSAAQEGPNMPRASVLSTLNNSTRRVPKATYVPLKMAPLEDTVQPRGAVLKFGYVRHLRLRPGEVEAVRNWHMSSTSSGVSDNSGTSANVPWNILQQFEGLPLPSQLPAPTVFATVPSAALVTFGRAVIALRQQRLTAVSTQTMTPAGANVAPATAADIRQSLGVATSLVNAATTAVNAFEANVVVTPIGWLNLERLEMTPAGVEKGELLASIPLAPLEQTSVVQKEWSVTTKEFTSIVTDSLENYSETGVTENTDLSQSTTSQNQHSNQFNVNATASGGIGFVSGSVGSSFGSQDSNSQSATDSTKHAIQTTRKASTRVKQEHKMTISTTTVTGTSETTTRTLQNPSATDPIRIDYFSMMRKWYVALYRYGLRVTYDIAIPEPGGALREAYMKLDYLQSQAALGFTFPLQYSDITPQNYADPSSRLWLYANQWGAQVPPPPDSPPPVTQSATPTVGQGWFAYDMPITVPPGSWIIGFDIVMHIKKFTGGSSVMRFAIDGGYYSDSDNPGGLNADGLYTTEQGFGGITGTIKLDPNFLLHATGTQTISFYLQDMGYAHLWLQANLELTPGANDQWVSAAWNALYNAGQTAFYAQQQAVNAQIQALQAQLNNVDTLTLRREENDEIMKGVLRWLLGPSFDFMPNEVVSLFGVSSASPCPTNYAPSGCDLLTHGVSFTGNDLFTNNLTLQQANADWSTMFKYQEMVKFINEAIEWENVAYFLYSYFWDVPTSWDFIRQIQHPDAVRQAVLRSGSARVVLTIRKGWETAFINFAEAGGFSKTLLPPNHPYLSIAQEIALYDQTNYPGIPPANPGGIAPPDDGQYTATTYVPPTASSTVGPSTQPVTLTVASAKGFNVGYWAIIDSFPSTWDPVKGPTSVQEKQLITAVDYNNNTITVQALTNAHAATQFPIIQGGEKGQLVAEWFEYTPTSGTDIAVTSDLTTIQ